jgi:hypothetical protein
VGPFRQQLIRLVACLVAINLAIGVVALLARNDGASTARLAAQSSHAAPPSAGPPGPATSTQSGSILAGGSFSKRRRATGQSAGPAATGTTATAARALPSTGAAPSTRPPARSTGGSSPSKARPAAPAAGGRGTTTSPPGPASASIPPPSAGAGEPATTGGPATEADNQAPTGAAPANSSTTPTSAPKKTQAPSTTSGVWTVIEDASGDTVVDDNGPPRANPRADIVQSRVANTTKAIGFAVKVAEPVDPLRDPNWASPATFVEWEVDTTGDGTPDFSVQYFVEGGKLVGGVYKAGNTAGQPACEAEAGYMSDSYVAGVDPACLGSPTSLSYRASIFYGTDPKNENADVITDASPDGAMSGPVPRTAA